MLRLWAHGLAAALLATSGTALAADESSLFSRMDASLGMDIGGPLLFADVPDGTVSRTAVFQDGLSAALRFGHPSVDGHALGLSLGYKGLARDAARSASAFDTQLLYAAGGDTEVQVGVGYRVGLGTEGFHTADGVIPYGGPLASLALRHSFIQDGASFGFAPSVFAEAVSNGPWSTAFLGTRVEIVFHKASKEVTQ